jgi:hypothetical protein
LVEPNKPNEPNEPVTDCFFPPPSARLAVTQGDRDGSCRQASLKTARSGY